MTTGELPCGDDDAEFGALLLSNASNVAGRSGGSCGIRYLRKTLQTNLIEE